nr:DUF4910 domain-containing protein [uncultured Tolumonas sp.]
MIEHNELGTKMYTLAERLWPICRSITGAGVRETLKILQTELPELHICDVPSGTSVFDWTIPQEWIIRDAYIEDPNGRRIVDFKTNNLHIVGYSIPTNCVLSLEELQPYLYSLPEQPDAIPYVTSYYSPRWGFCLSHAQRESLLPGQYKVFIDSELFAGSLNYGECYLPGESEEEILLSTYICHPSMANNELSGPVVTTYLANWLKSAPRKYSYRIVFIPETIGSITYLSFHHQIMKQRTIAGFVVTCVGDDRTYSFMPTRQGDRLVDRVARHVLKFIAPTFKQYSFLDRGSDERQYCSPLINLPVASIMRSKYGCYPEYHTSLDNMSLISVEGLQGGFNALQQALLVLERDRYPQVTLCCEPQLGKRGLYPTISTRDSTWATRKMMNLLAYADGSMSLLGMAEFFNVSFFELDKLCQQLEEEGLVATSPHAVS